MGKRRDQFVIRHRGAPVEGLFVQVLDDAGAPIVRTLTGPDGRCVIRTDRWRREPAKLQFLDTHGRLHSEQRWTKKRKIDLPPTDPPAETFGMGRRRKGPLLHQHHLARLARLLESGSGDPSTVERRQRIVDRLLPPLNGWDDILTTSAGALDGEPMAIVRFRQALKSVRAIAFAGRQGLDRDLLHDHGGFPVRRPCLLDPPAYEQLVLATALVSRTADEHAALSAGLERGLAGIRTLERVLAAAFPASTRLDHAQRVHIAEEQIDLIGDRLPGFTPWPPDGGGGIPDGHPFEDFIPELDLCEIRRQECLPTADEMEVSGASGETDGNYWIDSVSPVPAAAGSTLTITGVDFGPQVDFVIFPRCGGGIIPVVPTTASETQVTVIVPDQATNGPISLRILRGVLRVCDRVNPIFEVGEPGYFEAATPSIAYLRLTPGGSACVEPGDPVGVEWEACPPGATVEVRFDGGPWETVPGAGEREFTAPTTTGERALRVDLRASASGTATTASAQIYVVGALPTVQIVDVEFTQGIQTMFRGDGTPDNSLPLVAGKDTVVRVYVDVDRNGFNNDAMRIGGEIRVSGYWGTLTPINSGGPLVQMGPFSSDDRNRTNGTLNFLIPAFLCDQALDIDITIVGDWICDPKPTDQRAENISFRDVPPMPVRIRRIRGRAGNAPATTVARDNVVNAFTYLPSSPSAIVVLGGTHEVSWYVGAAGGYDSNTGLWLLSQDVSREHLGPMNLLFDGAIWVGLTYKVNRGILAWPDFWTCIAHAEGTGEEVFSKTAHEICHCLEFGHVRNSNESCNDWGIFDTTCEPRRFEGPLPDVPFRVRNNAVITDARDLMGYERSAYRFLNPEFWIRAMDEIEQRWSV